MSEQKEDLFAVLAEVGGHSEPLIVTHLTFARLMDDIIVPYHTDQPFFVDGFPVKRDTLERIKVIRQKEFFEGDFHDLHYGMRRGDLKRQQMYAAQYHVRLDAALRGAGEDVTSQVIKAFEAKIRPSIKDYLPKREELIGAALQVFIASMKMFGGG